MWRPTPLKEDMDSVNSNEFELIKNPVNERQQHVYPDGTAKGHKNSEVFVLFSDNEDNGAKDESWSD